MTIGDNDPKYVFNKHKYLQLKATWNLGYNIGVKYSTNKTTGKCTIVYKYDRKVKGSND